MGVDTNGKENEMELCKDCRVFTYLHLRAGSFLFENPTKTAEKTAECTQTER